MNPAQAALKHPYLNLALAFLVAAVGLIGFMRTPVDLFPETSPPQVLVITEQPGASARDVEDKITQVLEKEVSTVNGLENIRSSSRDQVSSVTVEFRYGKDPGQAVLEVQNSIARIQSNLPEGVRDPSIYRLSESSSRPLLTLALTAKDPEDKDLKEIRLLAENQIQNQLLRLQGVADVDVFGGHRPEVEVRIDRDKLAAHKVSLGEVLAALEKQNISTPAGNIYTQDSEYLVRVAGEFQDLQQIRDLPLRRPGLGLLRISDLGKVELATQEARSLYHGNTKEAIALGVIREEQGATVETIERVKGYLPELEARFPDISFEITQDQQPLIDVNMQGMLSSIAIAILLTMGVIFLFLADTRAALVVGLSLPLSFLFSLGVIWLLPYTLNMITLTGLIVATGLVVDSSVVVLENIYRRHRSQAGANAKDSAERGTSQIALANTAGTLTTVAVLLPIIFIGGYAQQTMGKLSLTISSTLVASLLVSLSLVPLICSRVLARQVKRPNLLQRWAAYTDLALEQVRRFYLFLLRKALRWRVATLLLAIGFFLLSARIVPPLIGGELMPPMDTGIVNLEFEIPATDSLDRMRSTLQQVEGIVSEQPGVQTISSVVGSEPGAISFGSGGSIAQSALLTVHLVDRTQRRETIWQIQQKWREELRQIPGIKAFRIGEYGAVPVSTTKAPLNIILSGPETKVLDRLAETCLQRLQGLPGLVDVRRSWYMDQEEQTVRVAPALAREYGTSPQEVSQELQAAVQGLPATWMRLEGYLDIPIRVSYSEQDLKEPQDLEEIYVGSKFGPIPLRTLAEIESQRISPLLTREDLQRTIDISGENRGLTISQVTAKAKERLQGLQLPGGYQMEFAGTMQDMQETNQQLRQALIIGLILLYLLLFTMFRSFRHPLTILSVVPLAVAGALWGLLLFDKPMSMPGNMGMIFLAGVIINNSVLLLDFINQARSEGWDRKSAIERAVELRLRPIFMTMLSTVVGLSPLAFEMAVGLERLSPLAIVAGTGLLLGTFLTMIVVPVVYSCLDSLSVAVKSES
ncbi:MAG: efflux RND transporter permease subunit [Desulfohalobiaceae bacterium]